MNRERNMVGQPGHLHDFGVPNFDTFYSRQVDRHGSPLVSFAMPSLPCLGLACALIPGIRVTHPQRPLHSSPFLPRTLYVPLHSTAAVGPGHGSERALLCLCMSVFHSSGPGTWGSLRRRATLRLLTLRI